MKAIILATMTYFMTAFGVQSVEDLKPGLEDRLGQIFCMKYETWEKEFVEPKGLRVEFFENVEERENEPVVRARAVFVNNKELFAVILTKQDKVCLTFSMLKYQRAR